MLTEFDQQQDSTRGKVSPPQRALGRSQSHRRDGPSSRPPRLQNAALRAPLRRKRHGRIRNTIPTSTPQVA
jgi:hypothetical protein